MAKFLSSVPVVTSYAIRGVDGLNLQGKKAVHSSQQIQFSILFTLSARFKERGAAKQLFYKHKSLLSLIPDAEGKCNRWLTSHERVSSIISSIK